ncbi:hypothetical protein [Streptomyces tanashiensis]|uniref:hypothetical protein n=1 Tax=Streptomyces tanashiensis TaxID=67367 RepID=UPI00167E46C1|nr:hypothetical protein [Streptomyces tanashiensis]GGY31315.1 hypothetical protein GCM10010299_42380 [Streptomyces tanashiensis]
MNPTPLPDHGPSPSDPGESEVRAVFARVALDVTPGPVPLAAVRRAGRARRRRRAAGLSVLGAAAAVAAVVTLVPVRASSPAPEPVAAPPTAVRTSVPAVSPTVAPIRIRTVRPGERVDAGQGHLVWLTEDGKHWADTDGLENFRSVSDGNIDLAHPGISHQSEGGPAGAFHSGLYYGTRTAGRVELTYAGGRPVLATLLELPDRPGWGVWYAFTGPGGGRATVTLYDSAGRRLADLPG